MIEEDIGFLKQKVKEMSIQLWKLEPPALKKGYFIAECKSCSGPIMVDKSEYGPEYATCTHCDLLSYYSPKVTIYADGDSR